MNERTSVLYVDDNPKSSRLLSALLEECGFRVINRDDPIEALALCRRASFDLALLDYEMPTMNGAQLAREIKGLAPEVPVVLISGRTSIPATDLQFVDAHFGFGTDLDDLLWSMRVLAPPRVVGKVPVPSRNSDCRRGDIRPNREQASINEARWADST